MVIAPVGTEKGIPAGIKSVDRRIDPIKSKVIAALAVLGLMVDEAYERTRELLALEDRPTCILYQDDFASFGGIKAIRQAGLKIPQDISVAGYDGIRIAYQLEPQLTTLKQDTDSIGRLAAEQLISLIEEPKTTLIRPYIVKGYVEKGQSVRDINHT